MELTLKRTARKDTYTIGHLYIDSKYFCDTIEDKDRGLDKSMPLDYIKKTKVYGKTAIPTGTYEVLMNKISPKYVQRAEWKAFNGGYMPRLKDVPGWDGVLIHSGNTDADTYGCIIVGLNKVVGLVINSKAIFKQLYKILKTAKDKIQLTIK